MLPRRAGKILITSSIAATMPAPYEAVYGATKAFDLQLAEGLRGELADMNDTKVGAGKKDDPAEVARIGYEALMKGKDKVYAGR